MTQRLALRLNDPTRIRIGRTMVGLTVAATIIGDALYFSAKGTGTLFADWVPHNSLGSLTIGGLFWFMVAAQPRNRVVWVFGWSALFQSLSMLGTGLEGLYTSGAELDSLARSEASVALKAGLVSSFSLWLPGIAGLVTLALLWFPDGQPPSRGWRPVAHLTGASIVAATLGLAWDARWWAGGTYGDETQVMTIVLLAVGLVGLLVSALLSAAGLAIRYRRSHGEQRRQFRWIAWSMGLTTTIWVSSSLIDVATRNIDSGAFGVGALVSIPIIFGGYGIAIWRHRLFDVDVVISRTLLFGFLAGFIGLTYVGMVFGFGALIGASGGSNQLSLLATVVVAFLFQPVRRQAERTANRLVYGSRATPYELLSDLTRQLAQAETSSGLLDRIAAHLADGTGASEAVVWRHGDAGFTPTAIWPADVYWPVGLPSEGVVMIERAGRLLGALSVTKPRGEELNQTEQRLMRDLAGSAGLILERARLNVALADQAEQLFQSRRRLMDAQASERRRLERQLRDSTQQLLVGVKVQLGFTAARAESDGESDLAKQIRSLAADTQAALDEIRALAEGIYPPLLESDGLTAAVRSLAHNLPLSISVTEDGHGDQDLRVDAAMYFCIAEALTNIVKHADGTHAEVRLWCGAEHREFSVTDDGVGFDPIEATTGLSTGLSGICDRLEAIGGTLAVTSTPGGGTVVTGRVGLTGTRPVPVGATARASVGVGA